NFRMPIASRVVLVFRPAGTHGSGNAQRTCKDGWAIHDHQTLARARRDRNSFVAHRQRVAFASHDSVPERESSTCGTRGAMRDEERRRRALTTAELLARKPEPEAFARLPRAPLQVSCSNR